MTTVLQPPFWPEHQDLGIFWQWPTSGFLCKRESHPLWASCKATSQIFLYFFPARQPVVNATLGWSVLLHFSLCIQCTSGSVFNYKWDEKGETTGYILQASALMLCKEKYVERPSLAFILCAPPWLKYNGLQAGLWLLTQSADSMLCRQSGQSAAQKSPLMCSPKQLWIESEGHKFRCNRASMFPLKTQGNYVYTEQCGKRQNVSCESRLQMWWIARQRRV